MSVAGRSLFGAGSFSGFGLAEQAATASNTAAVNVVIVRFMAFAVLVILTNIRFLLELQHIFSFDPTSTTEKYLSAKS